MMAQTKPKIAILAGGGHLPAEVAHAAYAQGHKVLLIAIADEADLGLLDATIANDRVEWGQVGRLMQMLADFQTDKLVIIGSISRRPNYRSLRLDWGAVQLLPRILTTVMAGGDATVLDRVAGLFSERGFELAGAHEVAPSLLATSNHMAGPKPKPDLRTDGKLAAHGAWTAGHLDMGQGAIAVGGRIVAMEGAEGTDGLLKRAGDMRAGKRFSAEGRVGVLAKCTRPGQDLRLDLPTIGPRTIEHAAEAGLAGIVLESGRVLISQREETFALCKSHKVSLIGEPREAFLPTGRKDVPA
jgi:DUF1009 family protein